MYLYIKDEKVKVAEKDIICYKVLKNKKVSFSFSPTGTILCTPVNSKVISESILNGDYDLCAEGVQKIYKAEDSDEYLIDEGYIHTCADKESLKELYLRYVSYSEHYCAKDFLVYECIIPKGTRYYEGVYSHETYNSRAAYASEKIRFINNMNVAK